jgi:short-subunit dehydrogenase
MPTALITGASRGIGLAYAQALAAQKYDLVLVARSQEDLTQIKAELEQSQGINIIIICQDLTAPGAVSQVWQQLKNLEIDLLVNNAGFGDYGKFATRDLTKQLKMVQLNVAVVVELTHLALNAMQLRGQGAIINVASIAAFQPLPYLSVYAGSKAFVLNFTEAIAAENRDYQDIKIQVVCPGPTESKFAEVAEFPMADTAMGGIATAEAVVKESLDSLAKGTYTVVTGGMGNKILVSLPRLTPRSLLVKMVEKQFSSTLGT